MTVSPYIVVRDEGEPSTYCCHRIVRSGIPCSYCPLYASSTEKRQPMAAATTTEES